MTTFLSRSKLRIMRVLMMLLSFCLLATGFGENAEGAPVTLSFEAEIGTVFPGIPFDSGIDFAVGDVISGQFTFEPSDGDGNMSPMSSFAAIQPFDFLLRINGVTVSATDYEINSFNNTPITDFPPASNIDSLTVAGQGLEPLVPGSLPNIDPSSSSFRVSLFAPNVVLSHASIPYSATTWNQFNIQRTLRVSLADSSNGAIGFQATIGDFALVPEPSAHALLLLICSSMSAGLRIRRSIP